MTKPQRVKEVLFGFIMTVAGIFFCVSPIDSYPIITGVLCFGMIFRGVALLIFYFRMGRYMVDGRALLYQSVIMIDLGLFTGALTQVPLMYVMLYLIAIHIFTGAIDILRAIESKKYGASWKVKLITGIVNVLMAVACLIFIKVTYIAVVIYAIGLVYAGIMRIITACRERTMVYIQ